MKYKYKYLEDFGGKLNKAGGFTLEDINKLGEEGWRVVQYICGDDLYEACLLEKIDET